jgi:hypothetical protein
MLPSRREWFGTVLLSQVVMAQSREGRSRRREPILARVSLETVRASLVARDSFRMFPAASDRSRWEALPAELRSAAVSAAAREIGAPWPSLPATLFLEYQRNGNRSRYEGARSQRRSRLRQLVVAECIEGKGRFLDEILNGIWLTCEETFWGVPAHLNMQKAGTGLPDAGEPIVDLFAADTGSLLAWTDHLLGSALARLSPLVRPRVAQEIDRRILAPCLARDDFWWMGFGRNRSVNNWNPWINSNWLTCVLLMEGDAPRRAAGVHKILRSLQKFLDSYPDDGGCDEGPGYWGHAGGSLFECLELLDSGTSGALRFYDDPLIKDIGRYIARAHIAGDWYTNFADAPARVRVDGELIWRYGRAINDATLAAHGAWSADLTSSNRGFSSIARELSALFHAAEVQAAEKREALLGDVWLPDTQVFSARAAAGSAEGFYFAAQGGHNGESHNHNDVGNFVVFLDGRPVLIDVGVEQYTAKTFSPQRYEIWTMQSAYHNCPTINGFMQKAGRQFAAEVISAKPGEIVLEIAKAYPAEARVRSYRRTLTLDRAAGRVRMQDSFELADAGKVELNLMTPCEVTVDRNGAKLSGGLLEGRGIVLEFAPAMVVSVDEIAVEDAGLKRIWGPKLRRIRATVEGQKGECRLEISRA